MTPFKLFVVKWAIRLHAVSNATMQFQMQLIIKSKFSSMIGSTQTIFPIMKRHHRKRHRNNGMETVPLYWNTKDVASIPLIVATSFSMMPFHDRKNSLCTADHWWKHRLYYQFHLKMHCYYQMYSSYNLFTHFTMNSLNGFSWYIMIFSSVGVGDVNGVQYLPINLFCILIYTIYIKWQ